MQRVLNARLWESLAGLDGGAWSRKAASRAQNLRLPKRGLLSPSYIKGGQWTQESPTAGPTSTLMGGGSPGPTQ